MISFVLQKRKNKTKLRNIVHEIGTSVILQYGEITSLPISLS